MHTLTNIRSLSSVNYAKSESGKANRYYRKENANVIKRRFLRARADDAYCCFG